MNKLSIKNRRLLTVLLLILLLVAARTVPLPQSVKGVCVLKSIESWFILRDGAGQLVTGWESNIIGYGGESTIRHFDRSDFVDIRLSPNIYNGCKISLGDTVAIITSLEKSARLRELEMTLNSAVSERDALMAGERIEDRDVALQEIRRAEAALIAYQPVFDRTMKLFEADLIPLSRRQEAQSRRNLLEIELELAKAKHRALLSGSRQEDVSVAQTKIDLVKQQIEDIYTSLERLETIVAPLNGIARLAETGDILLRIERTDTLAAKVVIPQSVIGLLKEDQPVEIILHSRPASPISSTIERISYGVDTLSVTSAISIAYAVVFLDNSDDNLQAGMEGFSILPLEDLTMWQGIKLKFDNIRSRTGASQ